MHRSLYVLAITALLATTVHAQWSQCVNQTAGNINCTTKTVGIGTTSPDPTPLLHLFSASHAHLYFTTSGTAGVSTALWFANNYPAAPNWAGIGLWNDGYLRLTGGSSLGTPGMIITDDNKVGIGTTPNAFATLDVAGNIYGTGLAVNGMNGSNTRFQQANDQLNSGLLVVGTDYLSAAGGYLVLNRKSGLNTYGYIQVGDNESQRNLALNPNLGNPNSGKVIVNGDSLPTGTAADDMLIVHGNIRVTGSINSAQYRDVAEWVDTREAVAPGIVVVLDPRTSDQVMASRSSYDATVAGVVSTQPGIALGAPSPTRALIATTGRVKVRVDATNWPIRIGDLLVTSDVPGTAMKSVPIELQGRRFHQPGTIIGKALEPLASGRGEILALLTLQ